MPAPLNVNQCEPKLLQILRWQLAMVSDITRRKMYDILILPLDPQIGDDLHCLCADHPNRETAMRKDFCICI